MDEDKHGLNQTNEESVEEGLMQDDSVEIKRLDDDQDSESIVRDGLSNIHVIAYTVGHFCNDLCAAMWFFYLCWYLQKVVGLPKEISGFCMLSG